MTTNTSNIDVSDFDKRLEELRALAQQENPTEAIRACDQFNRDYPVSGQGWNIASQLALSIDDANAALLAIGYALDVDRERPEWLLQKAACLIRTGGLPEARALAEKMSTRLYPSAALSSAVGLLLVQLNMHEEAQVLFEEAIKQKPKVAGHYYNLARAQRLLGESEKAEANLEMTIKLNPADVDGLVLRSRLRKQTADSNHVVELEHALSRPENKPYESAQICYAIAKELEDIGEYAESFKFLSKGAAIKRQLSNYDVENDIETMALIRSTFDEKRFANTAEGHTDASPIFVFGMPRTGTILVESILGRHSTVTAAGELNNFALALTSVAQNTFSEPIQSRAQLVAASGQLDAAELGRVYVDSCATVAGDGAHFVDKMPMNFLYAGLVHLALPKARMINVVRDPMDTCYAIYKALFEGAYPYSFGLQELANYFVSYHRLMAHWENMIPGVILNVRYEDMVTDTRVQVERLLGFCGLSWEEKCLEFPRSASFSVTASPALGQSPITGEAVGQWKNFEKELQPVADILRAAGLVT